MSQDCSHSEIKAVKLMQDMAATTVDADARIANEIPDLKQRLSCLGADELTNSAEHAGLKRENLAAMSVHRPLPGASLSAIYAEAEAKHPDPVQIQDIMDKDDWRIAQEKINLRIEDFNHRYSLDGWDYAIAGSCGLLAAMLDLLCVKAPPKPTVAWTKEVDGIFNKPVQKTFNKLLPADLSNALSKGYPIGSPDSSVVADLIGAPDKALNPMNHRLRSLSHDPILGFLFGVLDMLHGTCTTVVNGQIVSIPSVKGPTDGSIFQLMGRMFGHLLSDLNAPSGNLNRGMGLPAPLMGALRMFEGIPIGDSNFAKQVEWMYVQGYDFRQFVVTSIPMTIMEVLLRVFYVVKQMKLYNATFGEALMDTMPSRLNPRFRIILALAYGTSSAVNGGKMYITQNIMNASYASWMGFAWNGSLALKWALLDRHLKLWEEVEAKEIAELECIVERLDALGKRAEQLPA
jgi:hypothetical protein